MNVFFLERRTAPSGTFTRTGPRSGSARRGSATLLVKILVATVCFCGSFAYLCRTMKVHSDGTLAANLASLSVTRGITAMSYDNSFKLIPKNPDVFHPTAKVMLFLSRCQG